MNITMSCGEEDRISLLPDDLLLKILSFIPDTAEKAKTSVLSRRFRHLWAHHPSIRLGHAGDLLPFLSGAGDPRSAGVLSRYTRSVDLCIASFRSPVLRSLDLRLFSPRSARRWLRFAARRPNPNPNPNFFEFAHLTHLAVSFSPIDNETLTSLLSSCPSLAALKLRYCYDATALRLSSTKLAKLKIFRCPTLKVSVDAPNLASVPFCGNVKKLFLKSADPLLKANVSHCFPGMHEDFETTVRWTRPVLSLSHVPTNPVAIGCLFKYLLREQLLPLFTNPKVLQVYVRWVTPPLLTGLASTLQHYPDLEQLHIDLSRGIRESVMLFKQNVEQNELGECMDCIAKFEQECEEDRQREVWDMSKLVGSSVDCLPCLKTVSVKAFVGTPNEMKMLEYLLGVSSCLEELTIHDCLLRDKEEIHRLLAYIPRASSHMQIYVK